MPTSRRRPLIAALGAVLAVGALAAPSSALPVPADAPTVVLNEIVHDDVLGTGQPDAVELLNVGTATVDVSGWRVQDDDRAEDKTGVLPPGTTIAPGERLVLAKDASPYGFPFGLGKDDAVWLQDASGADVDSYDYAAGAALADWSRCPDGTGAWAQATAVTLGAANTCEAEPVDGALVLNEIDSSPADWIELVNPGTQALDVSGYEIRDNSDDHRWFFAPGSSIAPGEMLVVGATTVGVDVDGEPQELQAAIGIGGTDSIRVLDPAGALLDSYSWSGHPAIDGDEAAATWARCPDATGSFGLAYATPGEPNSCVLPEVRVNEVESNGDATDWVEAVNVGSEPVDVSGWTVTDNDPVGHAGDVVPLPEGTVLAPGAYLVLDGGRDFAFGLGAADVATLRNADGLVVDEVAWTAHADVTWARCPDGTGEVVGSSRATKGERNACGMPAVVNEVESSAPDGGDDWVELGNPTQESLDVSGLVLSDDDDTHRYAIPAGTSIEPGGHLVVAGADLGFGLGGTDQVRLFDGDLLVDATSWTGHAAETWGRCPDLVGGFGATTAATPGEANACPGEVVASPWPGGSEVRVVDVEPTFLEDSSGLDTQRTPDGVVLWAVDNGTGTFWKLAAAVDGSVSVAPGWADGKRARFARDAGNPEAAGPDTEGISVGGDGFLYLASERDNGSKGVNENRVLKVDPEAPGPDVVATQEWDLTDSLPAVAANTGLEAVEWVSDDALAGLLVDRSTGEPYDPADYPTHGDGLFFVALEDNGWVYAYALGSDGSIDQVAVVDPGLGGVMALDYDVVLGVLWAVCDDGCEGRSAQITFTGAEPAIALFERPSGMENLNNEGFATWPDSTGVARPATAATTASATAAARLGGGLPVASAPLAVNAVADGGSSVAAAVAAVAAVAAEPADRPVWWFADGVRPGALRAGTLPAAEAPAPTPDPTGDPTSDPSGDPSGEPTTGQTSDPSSSGGATTGSGTGSAGGAATSGSAAATGALPSTGAGVAGWLALAVGSVLVGGGLLLARRRAA